MISENYSTKSPLRYKSEIVHSLKTYRQFNTIKGNTTHGRHHGSEMMCYNKSLYKQLCFYIQVLMIVDHSVIRSDTVKSQTTSSTTPILQVNTICESYNWGHYQIKEITQSVFYIQITLFVISLWKSQIVCIHFPCGQTFGFSCMLSKSYTSVKQES